MKNRIKPPSISLPPPPPPPQGLPRSPLINMSEVAQLSVAGPRIIQISQPSPAKSPTAPGSVGSIVSASSVGSSPASSPEPHWSNDQEPGQLGKEEYVPARNISASRWADESHSPADEGEISDEEGAFKKRKNTPAGNSAGTRFNRKPVTPELGELRREGSGGPQSKSGLDEEGCRVSSGSEDDYVGTGLDNYDLMEVDEDVNGDSTGHQTEVDSDSYGNVRSTPERTLPPQRAIDML